MSDSDKEKPKKEILVIRSANHRAAHAAIARHAAEIMKANVEVYGEDEIDAIHPVSEDIPEPRDLSDIMREGRKYGSLVVRPSKQEKTNESWAMKKGGKKARRPKPR